MFQDAAECAHLGDCPACAVFFVWPWIGERAQASPRSAWWMRHHLAAARPFPCIAVEVPNVAAVDFPIDAIGADEQDGDCVLCVHVERARALFGAVLCPGAAGACQAVFVGTGGAAGGRAGPSFGAAVARFQCQAAVWLFVPGATIRPSLPSAQIRRGAWPGGRQRSGLGSPETLAGRHPYSY